MNSRFFDSLLFFLLCRFVKPDKKKLEKLLEEAATPHVLGQLFFNRMQAVAYGVLKETGFLGKVNREFRNSLAVAYQVNLEKNRSFMLCLGMLSDILAEHRGKYAMLKGALLCGKYPRGYRTSNDIDLLVLPENVTAIGESLKAAGFCQGHIRNGAFVPASRREIITSRMTRGETVPYILEVGYPGMRYLEVDINFSLDYKNGDEEILRDLISRAAEIRVCGVDIVTLEKSDFFIHLCNHLYKEATTYPWVKMKRDMTLYKFCDIYLLLNAFSEDETAALIRRCDELMMSQICSCVIVWTDRLLGIENTAALDFAHSSLISREEMLRMVVAPSERKMYLFEEEDIAARLFAPDRIALLKEV